MVSSLTKTCTKCGEEKPASLDYFPPLKKVKSGLHSRCRACVLEQGRKYRKNNADRLYEIKKRWRQSNADRVNKQQREWRKKNPKRSKELSRNAYRRNVARHREGTKRWYRENKEKVLEYNNEREKRLRKESPSFAIEKSLRSRLRILMKESGAVKSASTMKLAGCTAKQLRAHLESQFKPGMSWDNYGVDGWHIDHIRPCCSFDLTDPEQQKECFHYSNLQPLWASENLSKGGKWEAA